MSLARPDRGDDVREHAVPVRVVRSEEDPVRPDAVDAVRQHALIGLGGEVPGPVQDVGARLLLAQRRLDAAALLPLLVHALHPVRRPPGPALHETDAQAREPFRHAAVDESDELDDGLYWPSDGVHVQEAVESLIACRALAPIVDAQRHAETLELLVDGPVGPRAEVFSHPLRGDSDAGESEVDDGAARLADGRRDVLEREERDGSQARALGADLRGEVVVGAGVCRRVVGLDDPGHAEAAGREQDRDVDPLAVHVAEAGRDVVVFHPAQASAHARVHAVARHERAPPLREGLRQVRSESCVPLDDVSVGVDHFWRHDTAPAIQALSGPGVGIMPQERHLQSRHCLENTTPRRRLTPPTVIREDIRSG